MIKKAIKNDEGKPMVGLIPPLPLLEIAKVFTYGVKKYAAHNYMDGGGFNYSRLYDAMQRHLLAFWSGEDNDPESGLSHLAHAAFGCLTLLNYQVVSHGRDDRYRHAQKTSVSDRVSITCGTSKKDQPDECEPAINNEKIIRDNARYNELLLLASKLASAAQEVLVAAPTDLSGAIQKMQTALNVYDITIHNS